MLAEHAPKREKINAGSLTQEACMEDRKCWLAIGALAALMALALSWPVWARDNGEWSNSPNGTRVLIPDGKLKRDKGNPTGHGIVFIGAQGQVYCCLTPGGI
jgi:hypothetical protein